MKVGEIVKVKIGYKKAFGKHGCLGIIPPKADLTYKIELCSIEWLIMRIEPKNLIS